MTDRANAILVVLDRDIREDDIESTCAAIQHIKGVMRVEMNVVDTADFIATTRAKSAVIERLYDLIKELNGNND
jgi:hypothetical protein